MSWVDQPTQVTGYIVRGADWDQGVVANPQFLHQPPLARATLSEDATYNSGDTIAFNVIGGTMGFNSAEWPATLSQGKLSPGAPGVYRAAIGVNFTFEAEYVTTINVALRASISGVIYTIAQRYLYVLLGAPGWGNFGWASPLALSFGTDVWLGAADYVFAAAWFQVSEGSLGTLVLNGVPQTYLALTWDGSLTT